jgi:hypothetical protein
VLEQMTDADLPDREKVLRITTANKNLQQGFDLEGAGRFDEAIALYRQAEQIYRQYDHKKGLAFCLECQFYALELKRKALRGAK